MRDKVHGVTFCEGDPPDLAQFATDIPAWIISQPPVGAQSWLLAYADDGVIWGEITENQLLLSGSGFPQLPALNAFTLLEARIFGENAEIRIWRSATGFQAFRIEDKPIANTVAFDETYHLWGTQAIQQIDSFTLLADGQQGLRQAIPLKIDGRFFRSATLYRPVVLRSRHYLAFDEDGRATIAASRLIELTLVQRQQRVG